MKPTRVAVFGSSEPLPGEALYEEARKLGNLLARARCTVVTGGYGGVMEAASRGATEAGGTTLGVICDLFAHRTPNPYLTRAIPSPDLYNRQRELIERSEGFVVVRGRAGTLAELAMLWALERAGCLRPRPVVLLGSHWQFLLDRLREMEMLELSQLEATRLAATPQEAVEALGLVCRGRENR